jgi:hypothetical protein
MADDFVSKSLRNIGPLAREWINAVFIDNYDDEYIVSSILRVISHFDYYELYPHGMTMATAALTHKSLIVKENAIRVFENWENPDCLNILKDVEVNEEWLRSYIEQVIFDLEVLHQHAITYSKDRKI